MATERPNPQMDRLAVTDAKSTMEITAAFAFDAAHFMPDMPDGHPYGRMHGHSFEVEVTVRGAPDPKHGWVVDFDDLQQACRQVRGELDHRTLNEVPGLERPTLETLAAWIGARLQESVPALAEVVVRRPTLRQSCRWRPAL